MRLHTLALASLLGLSSIAAVGCGDESTGNQSNDVGDAKNSKVERQAIGNCWLYATASWAEGMHIWATGEEPDLSQSYWTFWHWFDEIVDGAAYTEISTGGNTWTAHDIIRKRGLMMEEDFIAEDVTSEMSSRQSSALAKINEEIKNGRLKTSASRNDEKLVLAVMMDAWQLKDDVRAQLLQVFGDDASDTLAYGGSTEGTTIIAARDFKVAYPERKTDPTKPTLRETTLDEAMGEWRTASYPSSAQGRRDFQIRVQKTIHDGIAAVVTWNVEFNAMESRPGEKQGSFNLETLKAAGAPGRMGGHMTVFEDYEVMTEEYGLLAAGITLDPNDPEDAKKLEAALLPSSQVKFFRIKNSWGALRDDRASAPGFPGFHDLYMDYLNGPISWCPSVEGTKTAENCRGNSVPFRDVLLPPGY